jgi:hypothetical protein
VEWAIGPLGFGGLVYIHWDGPFLSNYWATSVISVNRAQEPN